MYFRIGHTRYMVTFLFCIIVALLILFDNSILFYSFLMVCAHESAHLLAMKLCEVKVTAVKLEPFGIIIEKEDTELSLKSKILITVAGCAANLMLAAVFLCLYFVVKNQVYFTLFGVNICLLSLNALPVIGLDGGELLHILIALKKGNEFALRIGETVSFIVCGILFVLGVILCLKVRLNPSLCFISGFLLIQTFLSRVNRD